MTTPSTDPMRHPSSNSMLCPTLVGRDGYLQTLLRLRKKAHQRQGQIALINGEAGIGKSRLLREFCQQSPAAVILQSGCYALDQMQPYAPLVTLLRALLDLESTESRHIVELTRLWQGLRSATVAPIDKEQSDGEQAQQRLLQALTQHLIDVARSQREQPLVLIFEDLHWCDDASLEYLTYLAQNLGDHSILLLLTWRSEAVTPRLTRCLATIERTRLATELRLVPLNLGELETMMGHIFARQHAIRADFLTALHTLTEGNPFFTEEILRSLVATGDIFMAAGQWERKPLEHIRIPRTVQAAVQQRTALLSPAAQQLLTLAAVIGRSFDFPLLQHLAATNERILLNLLRELIDAQLVVESSADTFLFRHELTRQAVYAALLMRERRLLHRAIVEAMHTVYPMTEDDVLLTDLAYHCFQGELWEEAMRYTTAAGARAQRLYSPVAAIEHYTHALLAARHLAIIPPATLHQARGKMYEMVGGFEAARGDYEQALDIARQAGDVRAEAQTLLDLGFLWTGRDYARAGAYFQEAVAAARALDDASILANTLNRIGLWQTHAERPAMGLLQQQEALAIYEQVDDARGIAETLDLLGVTAFMGGDLALGWHYFRRAIALCRANGNRAQLATHLLTASVRGGAWLTDTLVWGMVGDTSDTDLCMEECEEAVTLARELHWPATEAYASIMLGHILGVRGYFDRALDAAQRAVRIAQEIDHRMWLINGHAICGLLHLEMLTLASAQEHLERAQEMADGLNSLYMRYKMSSELSRVYTAQGQLAHANQLLHPIIKTTPPMETLAQRMIWAAHVEWLLADGQPDRARTIVEQLIAAACNMTAGTVIPRLWYLHGKSLAALGREDAAIATLHAAATAAQFWGNLPISRRIYVSMGKAYVATGQRAEAHAAFAQARAATDQLAAHMPTDALRTHFNQEATRDLPQVARISPQKAMQQQFDGLTTREREVATLVAQGRSNRAIADELVLSERTIEKHVENIMAKLDVSNRTQIAVWATEKGLHIAE